MSKISFEFAFPDSYLKN